ncbi:MAG TPA: DoxX family protein [Vicinamibacterales bacterium]
MSHALSFTLAPSVRRGRSAVIALWVVQIALAGMFLLAGGSKLLGAPAMVTLFTTIGIGQWFRYVTGLIEVGAALALLVPSIAVFGALALVPTMIGAVAAELFIVGDSAVPPAVLLFGAVGVVWARRHQLFSARPIAR